MKTYRYALPIVLVMLILSVFTVSAQDTSPAIDFDDALALVRAEYGEDVAIVDVKYDVDDDMDDDNDNDDLDNGICWDFELRIIDENDTASLLEVDVCEDATSEDLLLIVDDNNDDMNDDDDDDENILTATPTITLDEAIAAALEIFPDSSISSVELEFEDGVLVWDVEFDNDTRSVDVSAETGNVLEFGFESRDDDDNRDDRDDDDDSSDDNDDDDSDDDDDNRDDRDDDDDDNDDNNGSSDDDDDDDNSGRGNSDDDNDDDDDDRDHDDDDDD